MSYYLEYGEFVEDNFNRYFDEYPDEDYSDLEPICQPDEHQWRIVTIAGMECEECAVCGAIDC